MGMPLEIKPVRLLFCPHKLYLQDLISPFQSPLVSGAAGYLSQSVLRALSTQVDILLFHRYALMVHSPVAPGNACMKRPLRSVGQSICSPPLFMTG